MTTTIRSDASGTFGALQHNGEDAVTFDADGILAGSYKAGSITDAALTLAANSAPVKSALNATGGAPIYACRAWVNFNGTGTVAIRASGNVSSITDNGVGDYTVNFTTAMPDDAYAPLVTPSRATRVICHMDQVVSQTAAAFRFGIADTPNSAVVGISSADSSRIQAAFFR